MDDLYRERAPRPFDGSTGSPLRVNKLGAKRKNVYPPLDGYNENAPQFGLRPHSGQAGSKISVFSELTGKA